MKAATEATLPIAFRPAHRAGIAGAAALAGIDGRSIVPLLRGESGLDRKAIYWHLRQDLGERRNLARSMPGKAAELKRDLEAWGKAVGAQMPVPDPANYDPAKTEEWMRDRFHK